MSSVKKNSDKNWPADAVERRAVADLVPYARNARTHSPEQVGRIAASIREWGWTVPVLVDEVGGVIAGHGRILAAQKLGLAEVPAMVARGWSEAQKRAYVIADNQLAISGAEWDNDLLRVEFEDLIEGGFDVELTGFDGDEIAKIIDGDVEVEGDGAGEAGISGEFLKWGKQRIPLAADEIERLNELVGQYVEIYGLAHGFARWLAEGRHLNGGDA